MDSVRNESSLCIKKNEDPVLETDPLEGLGDSVLCRDTSGSQRCGRLKFAASMPVETKTSSKSKTRLLNSSSKNTEEDSVKTRNSKNKLEMKVDTGSDETNKKRTNLRSRKNSSVEIVKLDVETDVAVGDYLQSNDENGKTEKGGGARTVSSDPLLSEETADLTEEIQEAALDSIKSSKRGKHDSDAVLESKLADNSEVKVTGTTCNKKRRSKKASGQQVRPKIETLKLESSFSEDSGCQSGIQVKTESEISLADTNSQSKEGESTNRGRGRSHKRGIGTLSSRSSGRGRGRTGTAGSGNATESPAPSSDPPSDSTTSVKKTRKRNLQKVFQAGLSSHVNCSENNSKLCQFNYVRPTFGIVLQTDHHLCNTFRETKNINSNISYYRELPIKQQLHVSLLLNNVTQYNINFPSIEQSDPDVNNVLELPGVENSVEKQAARMVVIRKRKMRIHKLKKLRKRMKFVFAKVRQKRRAKKEKLFQAELLAKVKLADSFDAARYVAEKLQKSKPIEMNKKI